MTALAAIQTTPGQMIHWAWIGFLIYWIWAAAGGKKTKKSESGVDRLGYGFPLFLAVFLLVAPISHRGWLGIRFVQAADAAEWTGAVLTLTGVAFAIWARRHIGSNWSSNVTVKEQHELIRTGPYARIRHPIYTGILLAGLGTAIYVGRIAGLMALILGWFSFRLKARREELFMREEFGPQFKEYCKQSGMFLPKLR